MSGIHMTNPLNRFKGKNKQLAQLFVEPTTAAEFILQAAILGIDNVQLRKFFNSASIQRLFDALNDIDMFWDLVSINDCRLKKTYMKKVVQLIVDLYDNDCMTDEACLLWYDKIQSISVDIIKYTKWPKRFAMDERMFVHMLLGKIADKFYSKTQDSTAYGKQKNK